MSKQGGNGIICKSNNGRNSVSHYSLDNYVPDFLNGTKPDVGLSNTNVIVDEGYIICQFTRENKYDLQNYYDTTKNAAYLLIAFGGLTLGKKHLLKSYQIIFKNEIFL